MDDVENRIRQKKLEEALEIKSLRRIISAYLNYPEAAEEDIKRWERSYRKLPCSHKEILSHLPQKYQKLRRCISVNSYFIFAMLQAFEPPLDMSQDVDICEDTNFKDVQNENGCCGDRHDNTCEPPSPKGMCCSHEQAHIQKGSSVRSSTMGAACDEELKNKDLPQNNEEDYSLNSENIEKSSCNEHDGDCTGRHEWLDPMLQLQVPLVDVDKVRCIIRNIVRDWAAEGQKERDQCYKPILEELNRLFPHREKDNAPSCLVPGAGLGRLALEISCLGFISQGNEFSYYMMICSSFILNHTQTVGQWKIHPWIHSNCNSLSDDDQLRAVSIPDVHPASGGITAGFSMCGGDFVEVYNDASQVGIWDAVVTCFFIDTAHNIVEYIETISKILKEGGIWINLGPLLYHFADMYGQEDEMSIELSLEDVKKIALHFGFNIEKESIIETTYTTNPRSMMQNRYFAAFWTMRKNSVRTT